MAGDKSRYGDHLHGKDRRYEDRRRRDDYESRSGVSRYGDDHRSVSRYESRKYSSRSSRKRELETSADSRQEFKAKRSGAKSFAPANGCDEEINYYVKPDVGSLAVDLEQGKYCVLTGVRQSGKTTTALYVRRLLQHTYCCVYVSLPRQLADPDLTDSERWNVVIDFLLSESSGELQPDPAMTSAYGKLKSMFRKSGTRNSRVILILDELNIFSKLSEHFKESFLSLLRSLKQDRVMNRLHSVLAIGTDSLLKELKLARRKRIANAPPGFYNSSSGSENSPFSDELRMSSANFTLADIESLLEQYEKDRLVSVDKQAIAASMLELTSGHKGLVGACCDLLHREGVRTLEMWLQLKKDKLCGKIFVMATYYAVISSCKSLDPHGKDLLLRLLRAGNNIQVPYDETVELLLSEGVVVDSSPDGILCDLKFSSLVLMSTLLDGLYVRLSRDVQAGPARFDQVWVITRAIERLDLSVFETPESENAEYCIQFEIFLKLKAVLLAAYPHESWVMIPEAKTKDEKRRRLDISVRDDGVRNRCFALEVLKQGTMSRLEEHWERSKRYADLHHCVVYMLNFILDGSREVKSFTPTDGDGSVIFYNVWLGPDAKMVGNYACDDWQDSRSVDLNKGVIHTSELVFSP